ncbi:MAG: sialate O-acetylesterase [Defluviitaleaceae bacterium]|nr:sialate O-acetylesterase [Defluviitaleaceae bacterium]
MIKLPAIFSDGMVINKNAKIWGWAQPGTEVEVVFFDKTRKVTTDDNGRFDAIIESEVYGGPHTLVIGDKIINDVYIGHVWLCGGQSNMEQPISRARPLLDPYIKEAPQIRAFQVEKGMAFDAPRDDTNACWKPATEGFLEEIFAVPFFFAQALELNTPIGLVNVAAGGTPAEGWLPEDIIRTFPGFYERLEPYKTPGYVQLKERESATPIAEWQRSFDDNDEGLKKGWHSREYDHSHWEEAMLLDNSNRPDHGSIWYRKDIYLPENIPDHVKLTLGRVVDSVKVYINGELVISVDYQYPPCSGTIPKGLLQPGKNTVAIRAVGATNKHHFTPGKTYELSYEDSKISLLGPWKRRVGHTMPPAPAALWLYNVPSCVYNYMMAPVLGYSIDGIIWYQGESNTSSPQGYKAVYEAFVGHMRMHFGDVPVIFTQLANFVDPAGNGQNWAELREEQRQCLEIENTAMAVTIDCGEYNDLHPQDKKTVGERLALAAKSLAYGKNIPYSGPIAKSAAMMNGKITINFLHGEGLWAKHGRPVVEVIDSNDISHHLVGIIEDEILLVKIGGLEAKKARFAWADCPTVVLYNAHGLPASPFEINL